MNKRWGSFLLKAYMILCLMGISFFTLYAYRFDVLDYFYRQDKISFTIQDDTKKALHENFVNITLENKNVEIIQNVMEKELPDYTFTLKPVDKDQFMYMSNGYAPTAHSSVYAQTIRLPFKNMVGEFILYPKFRDYLEWYRLMDVAITLGLAILLSGFIIYETKKKKCRHLIKRLLYKHRGKFIRSLSYKFVIVNVVGILSAVGLYLFMYQNRYAVFEYLADWHTPVNGNESYVRKMRKSLAGMLIDIDHHKENQKTFLELNDKNVDSYIYDEEGLLFMGNSYSTAYTNLFIQGSIYDVSIMSTPYMENYSILTEDQTVLLYIYNYPLISYANMFQIVIVTMSISFYLIILLKFTRRKVNEIEYLQSDIRLLADGIWDHSIQVQGNDEIAELGYHLENFRLSFNAARNKEEEARKANKSLISAISHDLRTPLTALRSYVEIIELQKGDPASYHEYLKRCLGKIDEIKELSDKMFMYSFVYDCEEETTMRMIKEAEFQQVIVECLEYLQLKDFVIERTETDSIHVYGNIYLMKRIFNNIVSNIIKYADKKTAILWEEDIDEGCLLLHIINKKREDIDPVESNHIGLKSIEKMMEAQGGNSHIKENDDMFELYLRFRTLSDDGDSSEEHGKE